MLKSRRGDNIDGGDSDVHGPGAQRFEVRAVIVRQRHFLLTSRLTLLTVDILLVCGHYGRFPQKTSVISM
jgi:hypothetical protein